MTIGRQLTGLMIGFTAAAGLAVVAVSIFQVGLQKDARAGAAEATRHSRELFAALRSVAKKQAITQQIVRQKDPDRIEAMIDQGKKLTDEARGRLQVLGSGRADFLRAFDALTAADGKCIESYLKGEVAVAQQFLIEEANPAFDAILAAMGAFQEQAAQEQEAAGCRRNPDVPSQRVPHPRRRGGGRGFVRVRHAHGAPRQHPNRPSRYRSLLRLDSNRLRRRPTALRRQPAGPERLHASRQYRRDLFGGRGDQLHGSPQW